MKRNIRKPGIIISKLEDKELSDLMTHLFNRYMQKFKIGKFNLEKQSILKYSLSKTLFQYYRKVKDINILIVYDVFKEYHYYDDFLFFLVNNGFNDLGKRGLVLGHFDDDGFFWTDYHI